MAIQNPESSVHETLHLLGWDGFTPFHIANPERRSNLMWIMKPFGHKGTHTYRRNKPILAPLRPQPSERLVLIPSFPNQLGQKLPREWC